MGGEGRGANLLLTPTIVVLANPVDGVVVVAPLQEVTPLETPPVAVVVMPLRKATWRAWVVLLQTKQRARWARKGRVQASRSLRV